MTLPRAVKTVSDWKAMVYRHHGEGFSNGVRTLLLYLADHMEPNRMVSVPRSQIARDLGVSPRQITQRMQAAHAAGLLDTVVRGRPGVTSVYAGIFPSMVTTGVPSVGNHGGTKPDELHGAGNLTSEPRQLGTPGGPPTSKRPGTEALGFQSPRGHQEKTQQREGERPAGSARRRHVGAPERSDAERSEVTKSTSPNPNARTPSSSSPASPPTGRTDWCRTGCGTYLNTLEGQATGYCSQHRKDHAA